MKKIGYYLATKAVEFDLTGQPKTINQLQESTPNTWVLAPLQVEETNNDDFACCTVRTKESEVLRGEIFIHDLTNLIDQINFSVETLISTLFIDFVTKIKEEGNDEKVIRSIVHSYEHFKK